MNIFDKLGFRWDRDAILTSAATSVDRAVFRYKQSLTEFVYDASVLEGNPFTYPEVQTLMEGVTVGGRKLSDQQQVQNLADAAKELFVLVKGNVFDLSKPVSDSLHRIVAKEEALEWGHFRGEGDEITMTPTVSLGAHGRHVPLDTLKGAPELNRVYREGVAVLKEGVPEARERGMAYFLFGALQQFYFDGNKRTSRFMMNGVLMSNGLDAISVPAARVQDFNEKMVRFYTEKDATEMLDFLIDCQPKDSPAPKTSDLFFAIYVKEVVELAHYHFSAKLGSTPINSCL